jgi:hypothetical protein
MVNWNGADVMIPITVPLIGGTQSPLLCIISSCCFEMTKFIKNTKKNRLSMKTLTIYYQFVVVLCLKLQMANNFTGCFGKTSTIIH